VLGDAQNFLESYAEMSHGTIKLTPTADQPRSQFLEMGHHFAQLLAYERALKSRSATVRNSLLNEMVRLSVAIVNLAMDNADERTAHLSDHICG
jgi:hypothetical protein